MQSLQRDESPPWRTAIIDSYQQSRAGVPDASELAERVWDGSHASDDGAYEIDGRFVAPRSELGELWRELLASHKAEGRARNLPVGEAKVESVFRGAIHVDKGPWYEVRPLEVREGDEPTGTDSGIERMIQLEAGRGSERFTLYVNLDYLCLTWQALLGSGNAGGADALRIEARGPENALRIVRDGEPVGALMPLHPRAIAPYWQQWGRSEGVEVEYSGRVLWSAEEQSVGGGRGGRGSRYRPVFYPFGRKGEKNPWRVYDTEEQEFLTDEAGSALCYPSQELAEEAIEEQGGTQAGGSRGSSERSEWVGLLSSGDELDEASARELRELGRVYGPSEFTASGEWQPGQQLRIDDLPGGREIHLVKLADGGARVTKTRDFI